jgi:hypothetical protein
MTPDNHAIIRQVLDQQSEIEALRQQLAECQAECEEEARLNGMGSEREASLMGKLAASQAREQQLRAGMMNVTNACRIWGGEAERARKILEHYLALPHDASALAALVEDAARYQWLRDTDDNGDYIGRKLRCFEPGDTDFDAAIDEAMKGTQK